MLKQVQYPVWLLATIGSSEVFKSALATSTNKLIKDMEQQKLEEIQVIKEQMKAEMKAQQDTYEQELRHRLEEESKNLILKLEEAKIETQQEANMSNQTVQQLQQQLGNIIFNNYAS